MSACGVQNGNNATTVSGLSTAAFDTTINNKPVKLYTLSNNNGMEVCITNFGGRIVSLVVPDKNGKQTDVVLGYDNIAQYADSVNSPSDFGAAIGRYANRINKGKLNIDGKDIQLPINNYGHCLHGGPSGWQYQVYDAKQLNDTTLQLTILSKDGDNNFPGNVKASVTYTLKGNNSLDIAYRATTDKETVINMTNHSYFNLNGDPSKDVENCILYINADKYTPSDSTFMTTGEIAKVDNTPMDFRKPTAIGKNVNNFSFDQIKNAMGIDHNWCLNTYKNGKGDDTKVAASLYSPKTGIMLEVYTNEPGIQVYTGNFLNGKVKGKKGIAYNKHASCCLETQKYPDTPNKKDWPTANLKPGEEYYSHCVFKFSIK
ncbi:aldose epimerase family protein [uncultured Prevotella sp.]|uniref:aldose epimerase family protein n=1 Tax=uncultured Prevotella sp. TaxID=159272 RepID=UPI0025F07166|nr:aldose epimerase family protein [uncultured Prevotella sp.]